jgi:hypothetical protein
MKMIAMMSWPLTFFTISMTCECLSTISHIESFQSGGPRIVKADASKLGLPCTASQLEQMVGMETQAKHRPIEDSRRERRTADRLEKQALFHQEKQARKQPWRAADANEMK